MSRPKRGTRCVVEDCGTTATDGLPIGDDVELDLGVCAFHHDRIEAEPARWTIAQIPIVGTSNTRTVVRQVEPEATS